VQTLWFNKNSVEDMPDFLAQVSAAFPRLTFLSLMNNPASPSLVCMSEEDLKAQQRHRLYVIFRLPTLEFLDAEPVSPEERALAREKGRFYAVRRAASSSVGEPSSPSAASSSSPMSPSSRGSLPSAASAAGGGGAGSAGVASTPFDPRLAAAAESAAAASAATQSSGAYLNLGTSHYDGRHSEGNRFIANKDL
jgi:hypothetical protein